MMKQYERIKAAHRGKILFFRLGDFYEMFKSDAQEASKILGLTLTARHGIPMCGIPYHAAAQYIPKLLDAGKKVAICEQTKMPEGGKGIAERAVIEILTPGTVLDDGYLTRADHNFIASISKGLSNQSFSAAFLDISTGDLLLAHYTFNDAASALLSNLDAYMPKEILVQETLYNENKQIAQALEAHHAVINRYPDWSYQQSSAAERLKSIMKLHNLKAFGLDDESGELICLFPLLEYVEENTGRSIRHINSVSIISPRDFMYIDASSQRNLELLRNINDGGESQSLFKIIDQTKSPMGKRMLKSWIMHPLVIKQRIEDRLRLVENLYHNQLTLQKLRELLGELMDIPRLIARVSMEKAHPKDLVALKSSVQFGLDIYRLLESSELSHDFPVVHLPILNQKAQLIEDAIVETPPTSISDGEIIRRGYDREIDELSDLVQHSATHLDQYIQREREASGIPGMRLKHNKVLGYVIEISKAQAKSVPEHFQRRQSLSNGERFSTPELKELADKIETAKEQLIEKEQTLFLKIRSKIAESVIEFQDFSRAIAHIDCIQSFSYQATVKGYTKPQITEASHITIQNGRHPVVESFLSPGAFVPNNLELNAEQHESFALITGPNMAGKSTFLRQNALIAILAQIGSFVPAESATVGISDKIFCRVGASDNLARGESTFLVEMNETAHILRTATGKSLVIMDEVGRGTSTQDGLSIAWAVSEYLVQNIQCRTLFASHFHQLAELPYEKIKNLSLAVHEEDGDIVFLNKVVDGPSSNSYGVHVAGIAGLPDEVLFRAAEILEQLQENDHTMSVGMPIRSQETKKVVLSSQRGLFGQEELVAQEIRHMDLDELTPKEALNQLYRFQKTLMPEI